MFLLEPLVEAEVVQRACRISRVGLVVFVQGLLVSQSVLSPHVISIHNSTNVNMANSNNTINDNTNNNHMSGINTSIACSLSPESSAGRRPSTSCC